MIFSVFQKNRVFGYSWFTLLWYRCYYPHRSRDALSPVCKIFLICATIRTRREIQFQSNQSVRAISVRMFFLLLPLPLPLPLPSLHLVGGHPLSFLPALHMGAQGGGPGALYVPVARILVKQVLQKFVTAFNCLYGF